MSVAEDACVVLVVSTSAVWALDILSLLTPQRHRCLCCVGEVDWDTNYVGADCDCLPEGVTCVVSPCLLPIPLPCLISSGAPPAPCVFCLNATYAALDTRTGSK